MNVSSFLTLSLAKDFTLLAGEKGLNNPITGVNILDNPKAADWLTPGELIVTSGYFFKESPEALKQFLESFKRLNIAAICIKPQVYLNPVPQSLLDLCNHLSIPLIEIPYGVAFSKIMNTVMNLLADSTNQAVQMALDINSEFLEYGLKGDGIDFLKEKLEGLLGNPLIIISPDWRLLTNETAEVFTPYLVAEQGASILGKHHFNGIPPNLNQLKHPTNLGLTDGNSSLILPVFFNDITFGYIVVLQTNNALTKKDYIVLEHASITIALELVHQSEKARIRNKVSRDFYRELLSGNKDLEELSAFDIKFNYQIPYVVFIISLELATTETDNLVQQKYDEDLLLNNIFSVAKHYQHPLYSELHLFKQAKHFIGLVGNKQSHSQGNERAENQFFSDLQKYLFATAPTGSKINFYIGSTKKVNQLKESYQEAKQMLGYHNEENSLYFAKQYYFENFLHRHIDEESAHDFIQHFLQPLLKHDAESDSHLLQTLETYLDAQQNLAVASRALFIHRNTLLYRLEKIEQMLNVSLADPQKSLSLTMALKLLQQFPLHQSES